LFAVPVQIQSIGLLSSAIEGFTFFRLPPREAVWKVSNAPFYTAVDISTLGWESYESSQHAYKPWCVPVPARHVDRISLLSAWVELSLAVVTKITLDPSSDRTFDCTNF